MSANFVYFLTLLTLSFYIKLRAPWVPWHQTFSSAFLVNVLKSLNFELGIILSILIVSVFEGSSIVITLFMCDLRYYPTLPLYAPNPASLFSFPVSMNSFTI